MPFIFSSEQLQSISTLKEQALPNEGIYSTIIREYTQKQGELRFGMRFEEQMQIASNEVAIRVVTDIFDSGILPSLDQIAERDATAVGDILFSPLGLEDTAVTQNAAWSGALLFLGLGSDKTSLLF